MVSENGQAQMGGTRTASWAGIRGEYACRINNSSEVEMKKGEAMRDGWSKKRRFRGGSTLHVLADYASTNSHFHGPSSQFDKWSVHAPCMDHGRYKSRATHVDSLGHPPIHK